jgi:hypothetical protein
MSLEKLIEKRKQWVRFSRENNFDFDSILAGQYSDPSHFIYELLQNAEDENAKQVNIKLFEDRLDFYHNGKPFDLKDIDGVTGIGISKKKDDLNMIGKFGLGFKSVFAVTQTPYIFSGEYKIKITDFVIPEPIQDDSITLNQNETLIRIPFNHKYRSQQEVFELVHNRLQNLGLKTLLFLKNIEEIKWQSPHSKGHYLKEKIEIPNEENTERVTLLSETESEEYLVIRKPIIIEGKKLSAEIAYKLGKDENGEEKIIPEPNSKLIVFFPTERVTFLNFVIQGPFKTTPNRENIPLDDEQNKIILEEIGNLIAESLNIVKNLGYLDVDFLNILPINKEHRNEQIYAVAYEKVKEKLLSEELLPTSDGSFTKANDALLARGKELTEFLNSNDIQYLFSRKNWLSTNITQDKTPDLRSYLIHELKIPEVDFESLSRKITAEFLQSKSDEWMIDFYKLLLNQRHLWDYPRGILRTKPIIRLENNEHIAPFDNNGKIQVYLPAESKSEYKTVKRILTEDEESLRFLKELGLEKPNLFDEINLFVLPKYRKENPTKDEKYFDDFEKLLKGYESIQAFRKNEYINSLSDASFIYAVKNVNPEEKKLLKPSQVYFKTEDLETYFNVYPVYFVCDELYDKFGEEKVRKFLSDLGVDDKPRRIEIEGNLTWEEKKKLQGDNGWSRDICLKDYEYDGLDNFIKNITPERSFSLWKLLLKSIERLSRLEAEKFFKGLYKWFYYIEHSAEFPAKFLKTLRQEAWLLDKDDNFRKPFEITFSELSDRYIKESPNIDVLIKALEFKPDIISQLPEEDREILEIAKQNNITPEKFKEIIRKIQSEGSEEPDHWTPQVEPDEALITISEYEPEDIEPDIPPTVVENHGESEHIQIESEDKKIIRGKENLKIIGRWGEEYVYNALKTKYQNLGEIIESDLGFKVVTSDQKEIEIIWLNKVQDKGEGFDFIIKENGMEIEYIEVKSRTRDGREPIEVTKKQWEFAKEKGDKYCFYVVINAGEINAQIHILRNPFKLWQENKLYPIRLILDYKYPTQPQ